MSEGKHPPSKPMLVVLLSVAAGLTIILAILVALFLRSRSQRTVDSAAATTDSRGAGFASDEDYGASNSVTILLGEREAAHGLRHIDDQRDGVTSVETVNGVSTHVLRLQDGRSISFFYFQIHTSYKQPDLQGARFEVEYLAPQAGSLGIHYDALEAEDVASPRYREAVRPVRFTGTNAWQQAVFHTKGDGFFGNRQNGQADFRLFAKTPVLYVRRVTVTREAVKGEAWPVDYSTSNQVTIALGREQPEDGLRHHADEADGRTQIENLDGVTCRLMRRENKAFGFLYFAISPSFKRDRLNNARVDVEYFVKKRTFWRLQFDGVRDEAVHHYVSVLPERAQVVKFGPTTDFARVPEIGSWSTATFHVTNAVFRNGQNGDADFRLEINPAEIYVRRVTVTREGGPNAVERTTNEHQ
jgi:hypothetical protein